MHSIQQAYNNKKHQYGRCRHAACTLAHSPPRHQKMLAASHLPREDGDDANKQIDERICPEDYRLKAMAFPNNYSSLIRGSTRVYEISVSTKPTI